MPESCVLCGVKVALKYRILDALSVTNTYLGHMTQPFAPFYCCRIDIIGNQ